MGLRNLKSQTIFLDTAPLIYFIEGNTAYQTDLKKFFTAFDRGELTIITLTLLEALVQPIKLNRQDLADQYRKIVSSASGIELIEIISAVAYRAAELKAKYGLKIPDSIQVGTALEYGAQYFLTYDIRLKTVKEIKIITPQEL